MFICVLKILGKLECFADDLYVLAGQPLMLLSCSYIYHIVYLCYCWYFSIKNECYRYSKVPRDFRKNKVVIKKQLIFCMKRLGIDLFEHVGQ